MSVSLLQDRERLKRGILLVIGVLVGVVVILSCILLVLSLRTPPPPPDTEPPVISGVKDLFCYLGDGISYRAGVSARDAQDGEVEVEVVSEGVDLSKPGVYTVVYRATDAAGNRTEVSASLTVEAKSTVSEEVLYEAVEERAVSWGLRNASAERVCETLYWQVKAMMNYTSESDKEDWMGEAYRALCENEGDCFTYYAVVRAFFEYLQIPYLTVERTLGARDSTHFWLMVNVGTETVPAWYHFDVCPRPKEIPHNLPILMTDADLQSYNQKLEGYYTFPTDAYPATP